MEKERRKEKETERKNIKTKRNMRYGSKGNVRKFRRKRRLIQDEKERHIDSCCRRTYVDRTAGRRLARKVGKGNGRREGVGWLEGWKSAEDGRHDDAFNN